MDNRASTPEERFAAVIGEMLSNPDVTPPVDGPGARKRFGSSELKVHNKIFAMLTREQLVVKLPGARVDALVSEKGWSRFDPRRDGRLMKEWLVVGSSSEEEWISLAREAMEFVGSQR